MNRQSRAFSLIPTLLACLAAVRLLFAGNVHESVQPVVSNTCAMGDPEIMAEIKDLFSHMQAHLEAELDCTHPPDVPVEDDSPNTYTVTMPDFCGYYRVFLTLDAEVPAYFHANRLGPKESFGLRNGIGRVDYTIPEEGEVMVTPYDDGACALQTVGDHATLIVSGGMTVVLSPFSPLWYPLAKTSVRVTHVEVEPLDSCRGGMPMLYEFTAECARFHARLGRDALGHSAGSISFEFDEPSALAFSRAGLSVTRNPSDTAVRLLFEDATGRLAEWSAVGGVFHALDNLADDLIGPYAPRRLTMHDCVVDCVDIADGYEIRYYFPEQQPVSNSPLPALSGNPFRVLRVRNPSSTPGDCSRIEVTEIVGGTTVSMITLAYDSTTGDWTRISGTGADEIHETVGARAENGDTARFREYADASGTPVLHRENLCHEFDWGSEVVEERVGTVNPRVTVHEYYDDEDHDGDNYGLMKLTVRPDGSWTRYTYDGQGRVLTEATPWLDAAPDAADALCRVVSYTYSDSFPQTTAVTRVLGVEVSRTYTGEFDDEEEEYIEHHVIRAASSGAAWNASGNLRSVTRTLKDCDSPFLGTTLLSVNPDGTGLMRTIVTSNGQYTVTTREGRLQNPWSSPSVVSGTRTVEVCDPTGQPLSREVYDIESGILLHSAVFSYDAFGRQTAVEYSDGTEELTEYGCCGPVRQVARDGSETLTGYDAEKRVSFRTANGLTTLFTYDAAGNTLRETLQGALGGTLATNYEYNEYGERSAAVSPGGLRTAYSSGMQNGRWTGTTVYPNGGTEVTAHYRDGGVYTVSGTAVTATKYLHSIVNGLRVTRTVWPDAQGGETEWEETTRDFLGRTVRTGYPDNTHSLREYDAQGRVAREVSPAGRVTLHGYDHAAYGDIAAIDMDADGVIDYAGPDLVQASRSSYALLDGARPVRRVQSWGFTGPDATPQPLSRTDTAVDELLTVQTSLGLATRDEVFFRSRGRVLHTVTAPDGNAAEQEWLHGSLRKTVSELEGTVEYFPDQFNRQTRVATTRNGVATLAVTTLDADGRAVAQSLSADGSQRTTRYEYDAAGNMVRETSPDGTSVQYEYDLKGNLTLEYGDTYRVAYAYDHRSRLVVMTTWRTPDGSGPGDTTTWSYDTRGRMVRKTYADGSHVDYTYDADGNVLTRTSARGIIATYTYDLAGRPTGISFSDNATASLSYAYDRAGRLVSVTDAAGTRSLAYDAFGNCLSETVPQVAGKTITRSFDSLNRRTGLALGTDYSATYAYDNFSRLASIASGVDTVAFDYRAHGTALAGKRWLRNDAAVAAVTATYDAWDNIAEIEFGAPGNLHSLGYLYDVADRRTQASLPDGTKWLYGYDRLSQVVSGERVDAQDAPVSGGSFRYAYDGIGNRVSAQEGSSANLLRYSANSLNQYTSIFSPGIIPIRGRADADAKVAVTTTVGGVSTTYVPDRDGQGFSIDIPVDNSAGAVTAAVQVDALKHDGTLDVDLHRRLSGDYTVPAASPEQPTYDLDGNLLSHDGWTYAWNAQDRLVSATKETTRLEFAYDYLGRRFEKKVYESNALVRHQLFVYDGFKQIAEYDALNSNALTNTYLWQPVGLDVPLLRNGSEFFVSDANKNTVALLDTTGSVADTYTYDPFGTCTHAGNLTNPFRFSSEYFDAETGLVYYNYRYYSPTLGRWISRDPIGIQGSLNAFIYLGNLCINSVNHLGLKEKISVGKCEILIIYGHYFPSGSSIKGLQDIDFQVDDCAYIVPIGCNTDELNHPRKMPGFDYPDTQIGWYYSQDGTQDRTKSVKAYVARAKQKAIAIAGIAFGPRPCCCKEVIIKIQAYHYNTELEEEIKRPIPTWLNKK
ncbi:MAG: RHS repeat-associated core domain-containing protein [Victivallales bacterium]|nr:RHS repeat-associated core domain-containing protein [Victivallales bacterium]